MAEINTLENNTIGILGSGKMGNQLARLFSNKSYKVIVLTRDIKSLRQKNDIESEGDNGNKGMPRSFNIEYTESVSDLKICRIILECLTEDLEVKRKKIDQILKITDALVGSCTSTFTLQEISNGFSDKNRINIIHFSNPVSVMKIVEVVFQPNISDFDKKVIVELLNDIEYRIIEVPDVKGFVINSILFPMLYSAIRLNLDYKISKSEINDLMKIGCGFPMGPFEIIELVGLDTVMRVLKNLGFDIDANCINMLYSN